MAVRRYDKKIQRILETFGNPVIVGFPIRETLNYSVRPESFDKLRTGLSKGWSSESG